jgi:hydrogenase maturation protein HypF
LELLEVVGERKARVIAQMIASDVNTPWTSSAGRLFDAVAALIDVSRAGSVTYEGQAAIEMEAFAEDGVEDSYPFVLCKVEEKPTRGKVGTVIDDIRSGSPDSRLLSAMDQTVAENVYPVQMLDEAKWVVDTRPVIAGVVEDIRSGVGAPRISARFHQTMADIVVAGCEQIRDAGGSNAVAVSGGVFQNSLLLRLASSALLGAGFKVLLHRRVPANDGGLALGQAVLANHYFDNSTG